MKPQQHGGRKFGPGRNFGSSKNFNRPRELFKAKCADCGAECEVPFKPTQGRPVYCRACFAKRNQ